MVNINSVLTQVLKKIKPSKEELQEINSLIREFLLKFKNSLSRISDAEIFVGGSFAKNTVIKKKEYDVDVFVRFNTSNDDEMQKILEKVLKKIRNKTLIHGSRNYFRIKIREDLFIELIPVKKVSTPKHAGNITDLSYSHVKYINRKVKNKKILDDIMLAKALAYACHCYGAESYIRGFSGYALELLTYHYRGFLPFIKEMAKIKEKKIIDIEKHHKKKNAILDLNEAKLDSPIILIDPTFKQRNALAALSKETFEKFKEACREFLKNPSVKSFEEKKIDLEKVKENAKRNKQEFILIEASTDKQRGDVAGSKLLKFYSHLSNEIAKLFEIKKRGFNYNGNKSARYFFVAKKKREILKEGPLIKDKENVKAFEKVHKNYFTKNGRIYAKEFFKGTLEDLAKKWLFKNKMKVKEMSIEEIKIL